MMKRIFLTVLGIGLLFSIPAWAMEQRWIDDLNRRFPGIGYEFREAVRQKLAQHGGNLSAESLIEKLLSSADYQPDAITNARTFGLHSELMLLYPAVGKYEEALREAKLLRDFVMRHSTDDLKVLQTFRGVYAELLIINERYDEALQEIEAVIALNTAEAGNYLSRGVVAVQLGNIEQAMQDLRRLIQTPGAEQHAEELFVFLMQHRERFQEARVQPNTMIDVMLKELEPEAPSPRIRIPTEQQEQPQEREGQARPPQPIQQPDTSVAKTEDASASEKPATDASDMLATLLPLNAEQIAEQLGPPLSENEDEDTLDRDYAYRGQTLTISFDKERQTPVSFQMFFLPLVSEATAFELMGVQRLDLEPTLATDILRVWNPYGSFSKIRLSLSEGQVIAMIVEP